MNTESTIPMVGASGAIGGVLGAYIVNYPKAKVLVLIPLGFFSQIVKVPAVFVLGIWFLLQFISSAATNSAGGGVAYEHISVDFCSEQSQFYFSTVAIKSNSEKLKKLVQKVKILGIKIKINSKILIPKMGVDNIEKSATYSFNGFL